MVKFAHTGFKALRAGRTSNIERPTSNECIVSVLKKLERSDSILRHSTFYIRYSTFCGSAVFRSRLQRDSLFNFVKFHINTATCQGIDSIYKFPSLFIGGQVQRHGFWGHLVFDNGPPDIGFVSQNLGQAT